MNLVFQFDPGLAGPDGFTLFYRVAGGPQTGFDVENNDGTIIEHVCSEAIIGASGICVATELGYYSSVGPAISGFIPFTNNAVVSVAYFKKDISAGAGEGLSDFANSHHYVPEPATYGLLGAGLMLFGVLRRRRSQ